MPHFLYRKKFKLVSYRFCINLNNNLSIRISNSDDSEPISTMLPSHYVTKSRVQLLSSLYKLQEFEDLRMDSLV